jgi:2-hydroxycyclohexanecarboxyl-CoA dehydrogenase
MSTRTALVTGAANGIGKAISLRLARDRMAVGVLDIDLEGCEKVVKEIEAQGGKAIALEASVADRPAVQVAVQKLRERFGPVTVVVNNAGTFIVTQTCLPDMKEAGWGRIVNISSSSAQTGSETQAHYSASKGAMISLTRTLSRELGPLGITVNTIPPGSVMGTVMSEANRHRFQTPPETLAQMIPMRRTGVPEDIANACAFLVGKEAGYVTGQVLGVNGGRVPN